MKITIPTNQGESEVTAYHTGVPGLVVHRTMSAPKGWAITHRPSGLRVTGEDFPTRGEAIDIARRLDGLTDWTNPSDRLGDMKSLGQAVREAVYPGLYGPQRDEGSIVASILPEDWELEGDDLDGLLCCPHGHVIEMDGVCPDGCVSPLRTAGMI